MYGGVSVGCVYDVLVCGGGPAGMAAAWAASKCGARVLLVERDGSLGGVLPQCVHDGFGLYAEGESLTGPRYAQLLSDRLASCPVDIALDTAVLGMELADDGIVSVACSGLSVGGAAAIRARSVVIATGCRERTRGQLRIPGTRPAGVMTAGCAQYLMNVRNRMPGTKVVILGTGDVGLIMARRMKLEGAEVRMVLGKEATGLYRNYVQCIREMDIPFRIGWTVCSIHGRGRLKGVTVAPLDSEGRPDMSEKRYIRCNTLLLAAGLIPERDIDGLDDFDVESGEGPVYLAGNVSHIHDLADGAAQEGARMGVLAAQRAAGRLSFAFELPDDVSSMLDVPITEGESVSCGDSGAWKGSSGLQERCTGCPASCAVTITFESDGEMRVEGCACERGEEIVAATMKNPERTFTGTVKCSPALGKALLPVRSVDPVPVHSLVDVARAARKVRVSSPVLADGLVAENVGGLGVDLIASCAVGFSGGTDPEGSK